MAQLIDAGDYRAKSVSAQLGTTSTGKEQIAIRFALLDFPGQHITYYGTFTDAAFEYTMKAIRAAGFKGDDFGDLESLHESVSPEVILVVAHEEYNGKVSAKVKFINSLGGMALKQALQPDQVKSFAQRMKGKILAFDRATGAPAQKPAPKAKAAPEPSDSTPLEELDKQAAAGGLPF